MTESAHRFWKKRLAPYTRANNRKASYQLITTALLFGLNWFLMLRSLEISYWLTLALAFPAAGLLTRLFIFQHDCGHGSFFSSRRANQAVGSTIGVIMLTPFAYWKRAHAVHHATSGNLDRRDLGDVDTLTVTEYLALSRWGRLKYRVYRNPLILLTFGPIYQFAIKHRLPLDIPRDWKREWASVHWTNLFIALSVAAGWWLVGLDRFLLVQVPISFIATSFGIWLFYVQHQFEDTYWRDKTEWEFHEAGLQGSSFYDLPKLMHWFTGNIGFHHIHHLASRIPNYHLPACFREVAELRHVTRLKLIESIKCARLALWDEAEQRLVGFAHLRRQRANAGT